MPRPFWWKWERRVIERRLRRPEGIILERSGEERTESGGGGGSERNERC